MKLNVEINENGALGTLIGRLDTAAAAQFALDMKPLMDHADGVITLDCNQLEFVSSSGLRHFLTLRKASMARGGRVVLVGVSEEIRQVFTITGFCNLFEFA